VRRYRLLEPPGFSHGERFSSTSIVTEPKKVVPNAFVNAKGIVDYVNSPLVVHYDARNRNSYLNAIA
jgi:hypothetical protein